MLYHSKTKLPAFKVGDCVIVPKVNRGPADPANIIAVVIDQKNDLKRLGTEHRIIKVGIVLEIYNQPHQVSLTSSK